MKRKLDGVAVKNVKLLNINIAPHPRGTYYNVTLLLKPCIYTIGDTGLISIVNNILIFIPFVHP